MRLTCPNCDARYEMPPEMAARLPARLRCARCAAEWHQDAFASPGANPDPEPRAAPVFVPPPEPAVPEPEPEPETVSDMEAGTVDIPPVPGAVPPRIAPPPQRRRRARSAPATAWLMWLVSIVILAILIALVIGFHDAIGHAWPPSQRLYRALGLTG